MITALSVKIPEKQKGLRAIAERLRRDRVEVEDREARGVRLRHVTYVSYSGELRLEKTLDAIGCQRGRVLCSERLIFPRASGFRRFSSTAFSSRLCTNFALQTLSFCRSAPKLRVALYDPAACCPDLLLHLLERCADVTVVTSVFEPYALASERALHELGAAAMVTKNRAELASRSLVIAPQKIAERLETDKNAVVLTAAKPCVEPGGEVLCRYRFKMPNGFDALKPAELSEEYFCSALYSLGAQYELGSIVPLGVDGKSGSQTVNSLSELLDNRAKRAYNR